MAQHLPSHSQEGYDLFNRIREWQSRQQDIPDDEEAQEYLEVSRLSASLLLLFKEIILLLREQAAVPKDARISLERSCSALILWSDGYGIAEGHLNAIFKRSSKLRYTLLKNLSRLGRALTDRLIPLADISSEKLQQLCSSAESSIGKASSIINEEERFRQSDDCSSDAGSTFSDDNIHEVAEDLSVDTRVLSSLDPLIKYPVFDLQENDAAEDNTHSTWSPQQFYVDKIIKKFSHIDRSLASRLGNANFERYLRCQATRDAIVDEEDALLIEQEAPKPAGTVITSSKFHDSGVGTSTGPTIIRPKTIISQNRKGRDQSAHIPQLPKGAKEGKPFSCVACNRTVVITNNADWERHIYLDLQPYACLDVSCSYSGTAFESREKWISHLALDHEMEPDWRSMLCPLCRDVIDRGKLAVTGHFSKHLEEMSLSALPMGVYSNEPSENGSQVDGSDDDGENPGKRLHSNNQDKGKSKAIANDPSINYQKNIPCNTLYVSNLPVDVSERELKAVFSKQQGFRRVLLKTTQDVPLIFVEFDDTSSALETVLDVHGKPQPLLRSGNGGVSLCFAGNFLSQIDELRIRDERQDSWPKSLASNRFIDPPGWGAYDYYQEQTRRFYYHNSKTNVTHWERPLFNPMYNPPPHLGPIHQAWTPLFAHDHQRWFYVNRETGRIQWKAPVVSPPYNPPPDRPPLPQGWIPLFDHRYQRWYYANQETKHTQWEAPSVSQVTLKEAAEESAQEAKAGVVLEEEGQAAAISKRGEEVMVASVPKKEKVDELLGEDQYTPGVNAAKTAEEPSTREE